LVKFTLDLISRGWFSIKLSNGLNEVEINASYISDSPANIISSVRTVLNGFNFSTCICQDEPGEYRIIFDKDNDLVNIKVLEFPNSYSKQPNSNGKLIFEGTERVDVIAREIKQQYDRLLYNYGIEGYQAIWSYEFPLGELSLLKESIEAYKSKNC